MRRRESQISLKHFVSKFLKFDVRLGFYSRARVYFFEFLGINTKNTKEHKGK